MQYYDKYGITPTTARFGQVDTVQVTDKIHFQQITSVLGISLDELKALNPIYKKNIIPASNTPMTLVLPVKYVSNFILLQDSIKNYEKDVYFSSPTVAESIFNKEVVIDSNAEYRLEARYHIVKAGESLSIIARKYGTNITELAKLNKMSINTTIHPNQRIIVGYKKILIPKVTSTPADTTKTNVLDSTATIVNTIGADSTQTK